MSREKMKILTEPGGLTDTFEVWKWFRLSYDCDRFLVSLQFQGISCLVGQR